MVTTIIIITISTRRYIGNKNTKAVSTMVGTGKENDTIWHFEIKYDEYCTFLCERFLFYIKVSSP